MKGGGLREGKRGGWHMQSQKDVEQKIRSCTRKKPKQQLTATGGDGRLREMKEIHASVVRDVDFSHGEWAL